MSGLFKRLEREQAGLLKIFTSYLGGVESHSFRKKTVSAKILELR